MATLNPLFELLPKNTDPSESLYYQWGTVQEDGSILMDTDTSPLADIPPSLTPLSPGDRIYMQIYQRRAVILGKAY